MSEITINSKNLSRFTKRLQKALKKHFGEDVPLHVANDLFSQALGVDTLFALQQKISKPSTLTTLDSIDDTIHHFIEHYFHEHPKSQILRFSFNRVFERFEFNLSAKDARYAQAQGVEYAFSLFFGQSVEFLPKALKEVRLNEPDVAFIEELVKLLRFDDMAMNAYIGEKLAMRYQLTDELARFEYKNEPNALEVSNYGYCDRFFVLLDIDFFERVGGSYVLSSDHYSFIDLSHEPDTIFYRDIHQALESITPEKIIVEFLTPIFQSSKLVRKSTHMVQGIGSHYIMSQEGKNTLYTVNGNTEKTIETLHDYYHFIGQQEFNLKRNQAEMDLFVFPINHPYFKDIQSGFKAAQKRYQAYLLEQKHKKQNKTLDEWVDSQKAFTQLSKKNKR